GMALIGGIRMHSTLTEQGGNYRLENLGSGNYIVTGAPPVLHPSTFVLTTFEGIEEPDGTSYPGEIAINTNSHRVYVTEPFSNELLIYNGQSGALEDTIPVESAGSVAVNQQDGLVYVSGLQAISILDDGAGEAVPVTTIQLNHTAGGLAINPANNKLYVASPDEHLIVVINTEDNSIITELEVGDFPMSMVVDPLTNRVYVADGSLFLIHVIDGNEDVLLESIPIELSASGTVGFDPSSGLLYFGLFDKVVILDVESGASVGSIATAEGGSAVLFDASTGLVLATEAGKIVVIDGRPDSDTFGLRLGQISTGNLPFRLAVDPSLNKVYILDTGFFPDFQGSLVALSGLTVEEISDTSNLPSDNFSIIGTSPVLFATTQPPQGSYELELGDGEEVDGIDFGNADPDRVGTLRVDAIYFDSAPANGLPVDIIQDGSVIAQGKTPVTFTLRGGEDYTILAHHQDASFFSAWSDNGFPGISRDFSLRENENLHFEALYANIPGADVVEVSAVSKEVFDNGTENEVTGVRTLIQTGNNIRNALDSGLSPKVFHLADGETYTGIATDSQDYVFVHWVDPQTSEPVFSRSLQFTATSGLTLTSVYRFSNSTVVTMPVKSKLVDGTEL
ncbi:MAG TPA: YncE family protein, partial [Nitrososphaera sp.]|nr:YncE family protein [Nitrososphaera sp.]